MRVVVLATLAVACGSDPAAPDPDAPCTEGHTNNPTGEFANTLIRGVLPTSGWAGNSWSAIAESAEEGFRYVEVDVRVTADGHFLGCREDVLSDFSTCEGSVAASTLDDLEGCTTKGGEPTPLRPIDAALASGTPFDGFYLDLKSTHSNPRSDAATIADALRLLEAKGISLDSFVAMSYDLEVARALAAEGFRVGLKDYLSDASGTIAMLEAAADAGAEMICVNVEFVDEEAAARADALGIWTLPWTYPEQVDGRVLRRLVAGGAGGLISGIPDYVDGFTTGVCWR